MPTELDVFARLEKVRAQSPVVHHLTNWVTIYDCAQVVKTLGGSPVMAHAPEEAAEMTKIASALVLNIGTLTATMVEAMKLAAKSANEKGIPVVLDVCGAGATSFRDAKVAELLSAAKIDIIKGNASEIARVAGEDIHTRGVDSAEVDGDIVALARRLANSRNCCAAVTGAVDIVTDGDRTIHIANGDAMMTKVVGTGCMATSVIGTFAAVEPDLAVAAACGLCCYGIAGELAAAKAPTPMAFKAVLFDCLYGLDRKTIEAHRRLI